MTLGPPTSEPRPQARHRGLFWLAALVAVFALAGGAFIAINGYFNSAQPSAVVTAYFSALARGDAARALSYGPVPPGNTDYLTTDVLKDQLAAGAISHVQVLSVTRTGSAGNSAKVNVSYQLAGPGVGRVVTDTVPMIQKDHRWWLAGTAVATKVSLSRAQQRATFAGAAFPTGSVLLFPGALPISFDTPNLEVGSSHSTIGFTGGDNSDLGVEASAAGIGAARAAVGAALIACLAAASTDVFCPVPGNGSSSVRAVPASLHGTLAEKATDGLAVTVSPAPTGVLLIDGAVSVDGHYVSLAYANTTSPVSSAKIGVTVTAQCYASKPTSVTWRTP
jgi:hypothetical protein